MRSIPTILLLIIFATPVSGQQETTLDAPRLLREHASATTDTARIILKCKLGEAYRSSDPDTSFLLAKEALAKSKEINFKKRRGPFKTCVMCCL